MNRDELIGNWIQNQAKPKEIPGKLSRKKALGTRRGNMAARLKTAYERIADDVLRDEDREELKRIEEERGLD